MSVSEPNAGADAGAGRYVRQTPWTRFRRYSAANIVVLYGTFLLTLIVIGLVIPNDFRFLAAGNLGVLFQTIPTLGILALGVGMLMIAGEFDLSVAGVYTLAPYLMGLSMNEWGWPLWAAVLLALFVGLVVGIANGLITTKLVIPSFIATLGMMFFLRGVVRFFSSDPKSSSSEQVSIYPGETFEAVLTGNIVGSAAMPSSCGSSSSRSSPISSSTVIGSATTSSPSAETARRRSLSASTRTGSSGSGSSSARWARRSRGRSRQPGSTRSSRPRPSPGSSSRPSPPASSAASSSSAGEARCSASVSASPSSSLSTTSSSCSARPASTCRGSSARS